MIRPGKRYKRVAKIALLTIPFQVFFSRTSLLCDNIAQSPPKEDLTPAILLLLLLLIVIIHLIMWAYNIFSHDYFNRFFSSRKIASAVGYLTSYLVAVLSTLAAITVLALILGFDFDVVIIVPVLSSMAANTIILIILELQLAQEEVIETKSKMEALKLLNLEAKHEKLKQQLHPHFLFNALNALRVLIKNNPENAEKYLIKLSDFLRFSMEYNEHNVICLKEELKFATDYLALQQTRFTEGLQYVVDVPSIALEEKVIPVFSIQLLIENAIKHNTFSKIRPLCIEVSFKDDFIVVNNNLQPHKINLNRVGVGLHNLAKRYKIISGDEIEIIKTTTSFAVYLKVL